MLPAINWKYLVFSIFFFFYLSVALLRFFGPSRYQILLISLPLPKFLPNFCQPFSKLFANGPYNINPQNSISRPTNSNYYSGKGAKTFTGKVFLNIQYVFLLILYLEQTIVSWE